MAKHYTNPCTPGFEPGKSRFKLVHASRISGLWGKHKAALALEGGVQA
ncbi:MAG: hypothetical protein RR818_02510 [Citrobacter sp.]